MKGISHYGIQLLAVSALMLGRFPVVYGIPLVHSVATETYAQTPAPDNTKTNKRDRHPGESTAGQQKENKSDRDITQKVRRAIVNDKSLSTAAHNVKIITQGGVVTLKGPVRSENEKQTVEATAKQVAGETNVRSEIQVAPKKKR